MILIDTLIKVIFVIGNFVLCGAFVVMFIGMHNNTKDGNTFRLIFPFVLFDKSQFTEMGNWYRVRFLALYAVAFGWGLFFYWYFKSV